MELKRFVQGCFQQHYDSMLRVVDGLTPAEMAWTPNDQCSSISFLVWHYGRTLDRWIHSRIQGIPQLWENGWAEKLGHTPVDPGATGYGYTPEQLQSFRSPDTAMLLEYVAAARQAGIDYIEALNESDFDDIILSNPRGGNISLGIMCQQLVWEFNQHGGQIGYLRGEQRGLEDPAYSGGLLESMAKNAN